MELEALRNDLLTIVNHYGKKLDIGTIFYVLKDVTRDVAEAYNQWMDAQQAKKAQSAEKQEPAEKVEGEVVEK